MHSLEKHININLMKMTSNVKGQLAVSKAEIRAFELGYIPSRPLYDNKYDLLIDKNSKIERIQVKYADGKSTNSTGAVVVKLEYLDRKNIVHTYQEDQIDALVVYAPKIDRLCFFPKNVFVNKRKLNIRIASSKNNQQKGIIFAKDYYW